jgi:hypothetical protein
MGFATFPAPCANTTSALLPELIEAVKTKTAQAPNVKIRIRSVDMAPPRELERNTKVVIISERAILAATSRRRQHSKVWGSGWPYHRPVPFGIASAKRERLRLMPEDGSDAIREL